MWEVRPTYSFKTAPRICNVSVVFVCTSMVIKLPILVSCYSVYSVEKRAVDTSVDKHYWCCAATTTCLNRFFVVTSQIDSHLYDSTEPAGVPHIANAHRPVVLTDPVCRAAHLILGLVSFPLHSCCILLCTGLQSPAEHQITHLKTLIWQLY